MSEPRDADADAQAGGPAPKVLADPLRAPAAAPGPSAASAQAPVPSVRRGPPVLDVELEHPLSFETPRTLPTAAAAVDSASASPGSASVGSASAGSASASGPDPDTNTTCAAAPAIELLPPSPTRSLQSELGLSDRSASDHSDEGEERRPLTALEEIARICVGIASLRSRSRDRDREAAAHGHSHAQDAAASFSGLSGSQLSPERHALGRSPTGSCPGRQPTSSTLARSPSPASPLEDGTHGTGTSTETGSARWWPRIKAPRSPRIVMSVGQHEQDPFARDVVVKGWQIVGGKSWTGGGKVGAYVVYEIEIALRGGTSVSILRRYTEFVQLHDSLHAAFPHLHKTIPPLPGKNHMSKFSPEFLEERRPRLQRFLRTVMLHPEMGVGGEASVLGRWVLKKG